MIKSNFKNFFRYFRVLCVEYMTDPGIYCAAALIFALCIIGPSAKISNESYSIPTILFNQKLYNLALKNIDCSAQCIALNFDEHTLFTIMLPVITAFPALKVFRQNSDIVQKPVVIRTNKTPYRAGLFLSTFFSGFFIAFIGIMFYVLTAFLFFPPISSFDTTDTTGLFELYSSVLNTAALIKKLANVCTIAGIFAIITIIICIVVRDKFLSLTLPMMVQYISMKISILYSAWIYSDAERSENRFLIFIGMLLPYCLTDHYSAWEYSLNLPFVCFFGFAAVVTAGLYVIFARLTERSIGDGI